MKAASITLSTVGAGGGSNPFLEGLAERGGGRFYDAANPASIPDIFLKETQQVSGQQIIEEPFFPILTSSSPILRGLEDGLPRLRGYNGTTAKPAAQTVLVTARDDPLLATWQYGLGRSVAWTSDSTGRWARDWLGWDGFSRFFSQLVSWTFPGEETGGIEAAFDVEGGQTTLHVESVEADGSPRDFYSTTAVLVGPDIEPVDVTLNQVAPGRVRDPPRRDRAGRLRRPGDPDPTRGVAARAHGRAGRSDRRRVPIARAERGVPRRPCGARPAGARSRRRSSPWIHDLTQTSRSTDLWPFLLILALILWPLDIALRRVSIGRREFAAAGGWVRAIPRRRGATAARTAAGEGLFAARDRATSAGARAAMRRPDEQAPVAAPSVAGWTGRGGAERARAPGRRPSGPR